MHAEVRRVARQLEADRKVTLSGAPRLLRDLHETMMIMASAIMPPDVMENTKSVLAITFEDTLLRGYSLHSKM